MSGVTGYGPAADAVYEALNGSFGDLGADHAKKAADAVQEAVAYRIASKLNTLSAERAQADDMNGSRNFKQAADVAIRVAKGGW